MKKLLSLLALLVCLCAADFSPAMAAQLENVGPTGDKVNSGDLNARRYTRMYNRWKAEEAAEASAQQQATLEQRYRSAPQTVQLAQEDPAMVATQGNCPCSCNQQHVQAAPRTPVQQQSLQPMYGQQSNNGMMPPVVITGGQY